MLSINGVNLDGWCSQEKAAHLQETISKIPNCQVVEVGIFGGASLVPIALACQKVNGNVTGVDPWSAGECVVGMKNQANIDYWKNEMMLEQVMHNCLAAINTLKLTDVCKVLRATSETAHHFFKDGSIDIAHLDANHSYEPTMLDCKCWLPKVKIGGYIYMDDRGWTEAGEPTVEPCIQWMIKNGCEDLGDVTGCAVLRKVR